MTSLEENENRRLDVSVRQLARSYGIEPFYQDGRGKYHAVRVTTLLRLLTLMGLEVSSLEDVRKALKETKVSQWRKMVDDVLVIYSSTKEQSFFVVLPIGENTLNDVRLEWAFEDEKLKKIKFQRQGDLGKSIQTKFIDGLRHVRIPVSYPRNMGLGYYRLTMRARIGPRIVEDTAFVIVAPRKCYVPSKPRRSWGISVQLYGLRSKVNWGLGDFSDLQDVVKWAGKTLEAGTVGVSPLHPFTPGLISPYSPSSRLFLNPLFLHVEQMAEFQTTPAVQKQVRSQPFQAQLKKVRNSTLVDYDKVTALKWPIFEALFKSFRHHHEKRETKRARTFERYIRNGGKLLERYAIFQALTEYFGSSVWRQWPTDFESPDSPAVGRFKTAKKDRVRFFQYLQWQCEEQFQGVDRLARQCKMPLGLYLDLPIGVHPNGADAWIFQQQLAVGLSVGAPPDPFNQDGQNWGLLAPLPKQMRVKGYQFFIETLRQNMRHGGVLRIDHALGLFRLFMIPEVGSGGEGAYVKFPVDELIAIVALESVRNRVVVVGEDLGTITVTIKKRLAKAGILSYRLLLFEKKPKGSFRLPREYPKEAVVSVTTHDLPTLRGFWVGRDIEWKSQIGLFPSLNDRKAEWDDRQKNRIALIKALTKEKLLPRKILHHLPPTPSNELCQAIYAYIARSPCRLLIVPFEDLVGEVETPNFPGIPEHAHPSWRRRINRDIAQLDRDPHILEFSRLMNSNRVS